MCWREFESVARDFRAVLYFKSSGSAMSCSLQASFHVASWTARKHVLRWLVVETVMLVIGEMNTVRQIYDVFAMKVENLVILCDLLLLNIASICFL